MKKYFIYFFVLFVSFSIVFDSNDYSCLPTIKKSDITVIDKFEELINFRLQKIQVVHLKQDEKKFHFTSTFSLKFLINCSQDFNVLQLFNESKIKSHLHLLQLF